jgi:hypothetical protein
MRRHASALAALALAAAACSDADPTAPGAGGPTARAVPAGAAFGVVNSAGLYSEQFTLSPDPQLFDPTGTRTVGWLGHVPTPWRPTDFDVVNHSRDRDTWYSPAPFRAMHGTGCQPFQEADTANTLRAGDLGSHHVDAYDDLNYRCRNHMMTALNSAGYGVIYVTPNAMVDWSGGEASVKFALATLRTSGRDWVDLWITPWEDNLAVPLDAHLPDVQGPPRRGFHIRMTAELKRSAFEAYVIDEYREYKLPVATTAGYESILTPMSTRRDTFELRLSKSRLRFGMKKLAGTDGPAAAMTWVDVPVQPLGWTRGVVQFGHHSFNPAADANPALPAGTGGTWHWDDFQIAPAVPFTMVRPAAGQRRYADAASPTLTLNAATPTNGFLRFAAFGQRLQVSTNGGRTWVDARRQRARFNLADRFHSYWMPIAAGATTLRFRVRPSDDDDRTASAVWFVRDVAVWSLGSAAPAAPSAGEDDDDDE